MTLAETIRLGMEFSAAFLENLAEGQPDNPCAFSARVLRTALALDLPRILERTKIAERWHKQAIFYRSRGHFDAANASANEAHARERGYLDDAGDSGESYERSRLFSGSRSDQGGGQ